ncbi:armadillo repeat containing 6 [Seminavis robusta]|uniref:Armadillo repeat containing 6 n=1 Tax=Seminavis robusta TaxID=568900 RepID=A0A9N8E038_9STRA|nr:armadillo repeat containing 6 [Seminavis robusta]|eukprot:Sro516_g158500.1 armadillo repeat containing 6 (769) ;mRNA; f:27963-30269
MSTMQLNPVSVRVDTEDDELSEMSLSFVDFEFPIERMIPTLFPYHASAGGSLPPSSGSVTTASRTTMSGIGGCKSDSKRGDGRGSHKALPVVREAEPLDGLAKLEQQMKACDNQHRRRMEELQRQLDLLKKQKEDSSLQVPQELVLPQDWRKHRSWEAFPILEVDESQLHWQISFLATNPFPSRTIGICHQWHKEASDSEEFCSSVLLNGGIEALLDAMAAQKDVPGVQEAACKVLGVLVYNRESHKEWLAESEGLAAILGAMHLHRTDVGVQEAACGALHNFVFGHEPSQLLAAQSGAITAVVNAMDAHRSNPGVQELGCAALANIACHTNPDILRSIVHQGGLGTVLSAMEEHVQDDGVQESACAALSNLIYHDSSREEVMAGIQYKEISAVLGAMNHHASNVGVQGQACRAVLALAYNHDGNKVFLAENGALAAVCQALKRHPSDLELQQAAVDALAVIARDIDFHKTLIAEADGIMAILASLSNKSHSADPGHVQCCLKALGILALHHPNNQRLVALSGGIPAVVAAMNDHVKQSCVQLHGCRLLERLTDCPDNRLAFTNSRGLDTVIKARLDFPNNHTLHEAGCGVMRNLMPRYGQSMRKALNRAVMGDDFWQHMDDSWTQPIGGGKPPEKADCTYGFIPSSRSIDVKNPPSKAPDVVPVLSEHINGVPDRVDAGTGAVAVSKEALPVVNDLDARLDVDLPTTFQRIPQKKDFTKPDINGTLITNLGCIPVCTSRVHRYMYVLVAPNSSTNSNREKYPNAQTK